MFQGRLFFAPSLSYSSSASAMSNSCMHIYCAITFCGMSHSAPPCFLPLPPRQRKNISSAKINCPGLAWACSKQIYLVPRFMSLHYETYTHTDRALPLPPSFHSFSWDRCLSPVVAHLVEQLNKLLRAGLASTSLTFLLLWQPSLFSK